MCEVFKLVPDTQQVLCKYQLLQCYFSFYLPSPRPALGNKQ